MEVVEAEKAKLEEKLELAQEKVETAEVSDWCYETQRGIESRRSGLYFRPN